MALDPSRGDLDWPVDTDVAEFYGIEKWEPPLKCDAGDSARSTRGSPSTPTSSTTPTTPRRSRTARRLSSPRRSTARTPASAWCSSPRKTALPSGRGWPVRTTCQKQYCRKTARLDAVDLCQKGYIPTSGVQVGQVIDKDGTFWKVVELRAEDEMRKLFQAVQVDKDGHETPTVSEYWMFLDDRMKEALTFIRDHDARAEAVHGAVIYGEIFGSGVRTWRTGWPTVARLPRLRHRRERRIPRLRRKGPPL